MPVVSEEVLNQVSQESFGPERVAEHLGYFPEVFRYLKERHEDMGNTRPVVTYATAVTVWAFRESGDTARDLPQGMLQNLWQRLSHGGLGDKLSGFLEEMEPNMWRFFLDLTKAAAHKEEWDQKDVAVAGLVYAPVLSACIYAFWPEEELSKLEQGLSQFGLEE
ncbi:MAG: hypothetical protein V5B78_04475 [Desulfohalobiaceae bacterium]